MVLLPIALLSVPLVHILNTLEKIILRSVVIAGEHRAAVRPPQPCGVPSCCSHAADSWQRRRDAQRSPHRSRTYHQEAAGGMCRGLLVKHSRQQGQQPTASANGTVP